MIPKDEKETEYVRGVQIY